MNKKHAFFFLLLPLTLVSCADTEELYEGNAYVSGSFLANRYSVWPEELKNAGKSESKTLQNLNEDGTWNGCYFAGKDVDGTNCHGYGQLASRYPDAVKEGDSTLYWTVPRGGVYAKDGTFVGQDYDIMPGTGVGQWADQSPLEGILYGQTKKLNRINSAFSRGYLSKLYNGQIQCDNWSSYSLVELDKKGYGTFFPVELHSASYFAFSCRGGSDTPYGTGRLSRFDITVTFYKVGDGGYVGAPFTLENVPLETNISAENTSLVGFYFEEVGYDPSGVVGMSMTYSLRDDKTTINGETISPSDDFGDGKAYHTGLILLEVFLPDSVWY